MFDYHYDAGLSAAAETLVGILKRVIVTPAVYSRFLNLFTFIFRALGTHFHDLGHDSRMSEVECAQLHHEPLERKHSTLQSHDLFALAKHLSVSDIRTL